MSESRADRECVDVIIIGAGASGLFCAFNAALYGKRVLVLDHANKAGKKSSCLAVGGVTSSI